MMDSRHRFHRSDLVRIATEAMKERGLERSEERV